MSTGWPLWLVQEIYATTSMCVPDSKGFTSIFNNVREMQL